MRTYNNALAMPQFNQDADLMGGAGNQTINQETSSMNVNPPTKEEAKGKLKMPEIKTLLGIVTSVNAISTQTNDFTGVTVVDENGELHEFSLDNDVYRDRYADKVTVDAIVNVVYENRIEGKTGYYPNNDKTQDMKAHTKTSKGVTRIHPGSKAQWDMKLKAVERVNQAKSMMGVTEDYFELINKATEKGLDTTGAVAALLAAAMK